ncbi:MAG: hypothetical protein VYE73_18925 [Acidobacteriota bacterium]|nr:hypothetical protein [Acidobacteriota bacterium]
MRSTFTFVVGLILLASAVGAVEPANEADIPRTADGQPDFSGTYNVATLTPLERPEMLGDKRLLTPEEAAESEAAEQDRIAERAAQSESDREAPPEGGDGSPGAAGNVGGYNYFWIDRGTDVFAIDGKFRTSIITDPPNGRRPEMSAAASERAARRAALFPNNVGRAFWMKDDGPGPYDHMEQRPLAERCLLGFSSTGGPPMLPAGYNNLKTIVQTDDHVMILVEMVHDARIIRLNSQHPAPEVRRWMGDSIGWWEGDTLVVDTTNFNDSPALVQASRDLHVVERFRRIEGGRIHYSFKVEDPTTWSVPWSGEYIWPAATERLYEYACHEGNYALGNIMRGARLLESEWDDTAGGRE